MTVRRITDIDGEEKNSMAPSVSVLDDYNKDISRAGLPKVAGKLKKSPDNDEEVTRFRKVRIVTKLQAKPFHFGLSFAAEAYELLIEHGVNPNRLLEPVLHLFQQQDTADQTEVIQKCLQNFAWDTRRQDKESYRYARPRFVDYIVRYRPPVA